MNYKVTVFEDNNLVPLYNYSGNEIQALEMIISEFHTGEMDLVYLINDEEVPYGILLNVDEKVMKKHENKKIHVNPPQLGVNPWGKVEILFEKETDPLNKNVLEEIPKEEEKTDKVKSKKSNEKKEKTEKVKSKKSNEEKEKTDKVKSKKSNEKKEKTVEVESKEEIIEEKTDKKEENIKNDVTTVFTEKSNSSTDSSQKKVRKCSNCKKPGHTIRKCPEILK